MEDNIESKKLKEIGNRLREARQAAGLTQADVAYSANINASHLSDIECGKKQLSILTFCKIIEVIRVSADEILRPNVPTVNSIYQGEFSKIFKDCSAAELESLLKIIQEIKTSMRTNKDD